MDKRWFQQFKHHSVVDQVADVPPVSDWKQEKLNQVKVIHMLDVRVRCQQCDSGRREARPEIDLWFNRKERGGGRHETSETGNSGNRHTLGPHLSICVWTWLAPSSRCDLVHLHGLFMTRHRAAPTEPVNGGNRVDVVRQRWRVITADYVQRRHDKTSQQRKVIAG